MIVRYLLCFCLYVGATCLPAFAQTTNFRTEDVLPNTIVIKYKGQDKMLATSLYRPTQMLSPDVQASLGIVAHTPMYDQNHPALQASKSPRWGEHCKRFGLIYKLTISPERDLPTVIEALRHLPLVEYAEPIYNNHTLLYVPNDPQANPATNPASYHLKSIKAYEAWDIQKGNANVVIGITDSEFNLNLSDLAGQDITPSGINRDIANGDNVLNITGTVHGSHAAAVAVGKANNGAGSAGVCFDCKMMPVKIAYDPVAPNTTGVISTDVGYTGILLASAQTNCKVVNMSWGRKGSPSLYELDFLESIVEDFDVVLVAAAGNDGDKANPTGLFFPASYNSVVLSVGATNSSDAKAPFSTYNEYVDICAPGAGIVAQSGTDSGTSFASPIVAGAVALVRAQYPTMNAKQAIARIVSTADNIDGIAGNASFVGKIGSGRLNVYRALSDPLVAMSLSSYTFTTSKRNRLFRGMTSDMVLTVRNHLNALTNLQVTLSTDSPHLTILDNTAQIGAVSANATATNATDVLRLKVSDNVTANTPALLKITYQEGTFTYSENVYILLNPGLANNNKLNLAHDDRGNLNIRNELFPELHGLQWQNETFFTEAGLILATSPTKVSNTVRSDAGLFDNTFTPIGTNTENTTGTLLNTEAHFEEFTNNTDRIGLTISQKTYSWNEPALENAVVVEYKIRNIAGGNIDNLYAGLFTNWDIGNGARNITGWYGKEALAYTFEAITNGWLGGVTCLTERDTTITSKKLHHYAFDNSGNTTSINAFDNFTKTEKYNAISGGIFNQSVGWPIGLDVANLLAVRLPDVKLGDVRTVAFAYVTAEKLDSLKARSQKVYQRYKQIKTSPTPTVTNASTCAGGQVLITPSGGTKFNFYAENPATTTAPILYTGAAFLVTNITINQTLWVASVDSVFASTAVPVQIAVVNHKTTFSQPNDSLDLGAGGEMTLTSTAVGATSWKWSITKVAGTSNADITFLGGTSATSPTPQVKFTKNGNYIIKLNTQNAQGCKDSTTTTLFVYTELTTGLAELLRQNTQVYPNPAHEVCYVAIKNITEKVELTLLDNEGKAIQQLAYQNNPEQPYKLSLVGLPAGAYLVRIRLKQGTWSEKIIVQ
ncbi:MAG: T9SS C-terminal target domain-containing protein [Bacteroidetes bacterium]|nr:MAG: T9SS C-terminal target domain-containing protein [Bacteroidota bacterium]